MYYLRGWYAKRDGYYPGGPDSLGGFAPLFSYSKWSQKNSQGFNHGFNLVAALEVMEKEGVETAVDELAGRFTIYNASNVTEKKKRRRLQHPVCGCCYIPWDQHGGIDQGKMLAGGNPVAITMNIYSEFFALNANNYTINIPLAGSEVQGVHNVFAYKYDQTGLWIENQWGKRKLGRPWVRQAQLGLRQPVRPAGCFHDADNTSGPTAAIS